LNDILIGHRGEPETWPENSLAGYREVLQAGARYIETDVQITADGVPVLCHDPSLLKITGHDLPVTSTASIDVLALPAGYPERFGDRYNDYRIGTLAEFAALLAEWPDAHAFVEIKHASVVAFGAGKVIDIMLEALANVLSQCTLISFEYEPLQHVRDRTMLPIGWVVPHWSDDSQLMAESLAPEFLFVNQKRLPPSPEPLWPGPWCWVVYTINESAAIAPLLARGFGLIETNVIRSLLAESTEHD
jgi:glycerophosphoryl diester phosphodiesterase